MTDGPRTAALIGATGLVGRALLDLLLSDGRFEAVRVLARRSVGLTHRKLVEHVIDFDAPDTWQSLLRGDVLFSALGTTLRAAGSQEAQFKVDHTYQFRAAQAARRNGTDAYVLISSAWAAADARSFYLRIKGELERDTDALRFPRTRFLRPGPLYGGRRGRPGETAAIGVMRMLGPVLPRSIRPIHATAVARAAIAASFDPTAGTVIYEPDDVARLGAGG